MVNLSLVDARTMAIVPFTIDHTVDIAKARKEATHPAEAHPPLDVTLARQSMD